MFFKVVDLVIAAESHVARQRDDLHARSQHEEGHVETHLVVACTRRTVGNGIGTYLVCITGNRECLEDTFGADGDRVGASAQHVAEYHILQALLVVLMRHVERHVLLCAQLVGVLFVLFQLLTAEPARVGTGGIYFIAFLLGKVHHCEGGVQPSAECYYYFLLHISIAVFVCRFCFSLLLRGRRGAGLRGRTSLPCRCNTCGSCAPVCRGSRIRCSPARMPRRR